MKIIRATAKHLSPTAALFDQYRMFYEQPSDLGRATAFIEANIAHDRSQIFLLLDDDERAVAFAQLYPTWCSTAMKPFMYLSDMFVTPSARRRGHAKTLMQFLIANVGEQAMQRLTLETARTNLKAQALYESLGYEQDRVFLTYHRVL